VNAPPDAGAVAASATVASPEARPSQALAPLSQITNGLTLIGAKAISMGLGFAFWVIAARFFAPRQVGIAAGAVSAMMLCTQIAQLGFGSAFITHFPALQRRPAPLLNTSFTLTAALGVVGGLLFVALAGFAFSQLNIVAQSWGFMALFVVASLFGTLGILYDQVATALRRGDQALFRNVAFGAGTVVLLAAIVAGTHHASAESIFMPWAVAGLLALVIGLRQVRRTLPAYRLRLKVHWQLARELMHVGMPNYALTLAERAPGLILPVVVAELLSPASNATWYTVWMMAWVLYIVPIQVGLTIFSEASHDPGALRESIRRGVLCSLAVGAVGAVVLGLGAHLALSILGHHYASGGVWPLRILVVAFVPLSFVQAYYSAARARRRLREAVVVAWSTTLVSVGLAAAAGVIGGLTAMAAAWVAVQFFTGAWSMWRLRAIRHDIREGEPVL
jgi:O-antigen/teichoic acid export membrane protein